MMKWLRTHTRLAIFIAIVLALSILLTVSYVHKGNSSTIGRFINGGLAKVQEPLSNAGNGIAKGFSGLFSFRTLARENEKLKDQVAELEKEIIQLQFSRLELQELRELSGALNYVNVETVYSHVSADVISLDGSNWFNIFTINKGTLQGVKKDAIVVNGDGLVGRILEAGDDWAKVIGVIDESSNVSFKIFRDQGLNYLGILDGDGKGGLKGYMLDPDAAIIEGDLLITSGIGLYPAGITVGKISQVSEDTDTLLKTIKIQPSVNFKDIEKVVVIVPAEGQAGSSEESPAGSPAESPEEGRAGG